MAIKKISEFVSATPSSDSKILFEQNGKGKSCTVGDVGKAIGINLDLLWENASPKSQFANQVLSLDLSEYKAVIIQATWMYTWTIDKIAILQFVCNKNENYLLLGGANTTGIRRTYITENSIWFDDAFYFTTFNSDNREMLNELLVPKRIYGVK